MGLVVTREPGESVEIGPEIRVKVVSVVGNRCKIVIEAPPNILLMRSEVAERIRQQARATTGRESRPQE